MPIKALVFDVYGTLFDVHSIATHCAREWHTDGNAFSQLWRRKQLEYTWLLSLMGRYEDFRAVTERALRHSCEALSLSLKQAQVDAAMAAYASLTPFDDVRQSLGDLKGLRLAVLSNGCPSMLDPLMYNARLDGYFEAILSVDSVGIFKPSPRTYRLAEEALGVDREEIGFISSNSWDISGAGAFGFKTFWINRSSTTPDNLGIAPGVVIRSLSELGNWVRR